LSKTITVKLQVYRVFKIFPYLIPSQKYLFSHVILTLECQANWEGHANSSSCLLGPVLPLNFPNFSFSGRRSEDATNGFLLPSCFLLELGFKKILTEFIGKRIQKEALKVKG
jgi:hypothetical protein